MNNLEKINNSNNLKCGDFSKALHEVAIGNTSDSDKLLKQVQCDIVKKMRNNMIITCAIIVLVNIYYYLS